MLGVIVRRKHPFCKAKNIPDSKEGSVERERALLNGYFYSSKSIV